MLELRELPGEHGRRAEVAVIGQIRDFMRGTYFDNEVPIVVQEGRKYVVLEGNRRVSALKAIQQPDLGPR